MIRAAGTSRGRTTLMLGIAYPSLMRMLDGEPIRATTVDLGVRPAFELWLLAGETHQDLLDDLSLIGCGHGDHALDDGTGVLAFTATTVGEGPARFASGQKVFVIGLTRRACLALIDGTCLDMPAPAFGAPGAPDPQVMIVSDRTEDAIADRLTRNGWLTGRTRIVDNRDVRQDTGA